MPIFELEAGGKTYEIEAPHQAAALEAFQGTSTPAAPAAPGIADRIKSLWDNPPAGPSLIGMAKSIYEGVTLPGDVVSGKVQTRGDDGYLSPEMIRRSTSLASIPMVATTGAPAGALGSGVIRPRPAAAAAPAVSQDMLQAAERQGVSIPQFLASNDMTTQRIAAGLKNIPGAGDQIVKSTENVVTGLGGAAKRVEQGLGTGSPEVAGSAAKDSIADWMTNTSKEIANRVYGEVDPLVNPNHMRELYATRNAMADIMAQRAQSKIPGKSPAVGLVTDAVQTPGGLNYEGIKGLRTFLGDMTPEELVAKGIAPKESKRLYGALTEDLKGTILDAGGPQALSKFERANSVFQKISERQQALSKIIGAKGDAAPEAVFSRLLAMSGSKSSADMSRLLQARKAMGQEAWSEISSAVVSKLGRDPQGNFSPERFFTAYGNLSPAGKNILFKTTGERDVARSLEDINLIVNAIKDRVTRFGNPSGTAQNLIGASMAGAVFSDPTHLLKSLGGLLGGNVLAAALSKPATAKAVADFVKVASPPSRNPPSKALVEASARNLANVLGGGTELAVKIQSVVQTRAEGDQPFVQRERR